MTPRDLRRRCPMTSPPCSPCGRTRRSRPPPIRPRHSPGCCTATWRAHRGRGRRPDRRFRHRRVGRVARLGLPARRGAGHRRAGSGALSCAPPRTAWPSSGRGACTRSSSGERPRRGFLAGVGLGASARAAAFYQGLVRPVDRSVRPGLSLSLPLPAAARGAARRGTTRATATTTRGTSGTQRPLPGAADPDARSVGHVVGYVQRDGAHRVDCVSRSGAQSGEPGREGPGPTRARVRRKTSPSTSAGDQARASDPSAGSADAPCRRPRSRRHCRRGRARGRAGGGPGRRSMPPARPAPSAGRRASASAHTARDQPDRWPGPRRPVATGKRPPRSSRRRRGGPGTPPGGRARRARRCSPARSARPTRRHPGATPGPRPHRRARQDRTGRAPATSARTRSAALGTKGIRPARAHRALLVPPVERRARRFVAAQPCRRAGH